MASVVLALLWLPVAGPIGVPLAPVPGPSQALAPGSLPDVNATAWLLYDEDFDLVVGALNPDEPLPMASTTKIMTALVVLERAAPDEVVTISRSAAATGFKEVGLVAGERWTIGDLLGAMVVGSANDAATALAEYVGGSAEGFVAMMNEKAQELGLTSSYFTNPHGLDGRPHVTSAHDLLITARAAMAYPLFADLVRTRFLEFPPAPDGSPRAMENTNTLLSTYPGAIGVKTGHTRAAGWLVVALVEQDGRRVWAIVMGSDDALDGAARLFDYALYDFTKTDRRRAEVARLLPADAVARLASVVRLWNRADVPPGGLRSAA